MCVYTSLCSRFFRDLVKDCCSSPPKSIICQWLKAIEEFTGTNIAYSPEVYKVLVNRANYVNSVARKRRVGGKQLDAFYSSKWTFKVQATCAVDVLHQEKEEMKLKLNEAEEQVRRLK